LQDMVGLPGHYYRANGDV
jgi:hypothetical protein